MPSLVAKNAIRRAQGLRRQMTDGEEKLWAELREFRRLYGLHARKQVPIGPYVADFAIHSASIIIEVDGEYHFTDSGIAHDNKRDAWLKSKGYQILRFTTTDLDDAFDGCVEEILRATGKL